MTGEGISNEELFSLFEAARWAPSSYNEQPWRFIYARREDIDAFKRMMDLLVDSNQLWCKNASALVLLASKKDFEKTGKLNMTHAFDTGSAWENLALEGSRRKLVIHGMAGFNYDEALKGLEIPDRFSVQMMFAIGKRATKESLPKDIQENEVPSERKSINEIVFNGVFGNKIL
jgi:nitroreductase